METISNTKPRFERECKFWAMGKCTKGDQCLYSHSCNHTLGSCPPLGPKVVPRVIHVRWSAPPPDWIKINTDGAVRGSTGASSCGAVFRDYKGQVRGAFSSFLGNNLTPLEAEMTAAMRAIDIASSYGLRKVWLESDSTQTVDLIKNRVKEVAEFMREDWCNMLNQIQAMEDVVISHICREGNTVADKLANHAIASRDSFTAWEEAPDFILREAQLDASGHTYSRVKKTNF